MKLLHKIPKQVGTQNGIKVKRFYPWETKYNPNWKAPLCHAIRKYTERDSYTVHIGGGYGIAPTISAIEGSQVCVYEPSVTFAEKVYETAELNGVIDDIFVINQAVGDKGQIWGESNGSVDPSRLSSNADILVLDCEGAEYDIICKLVYYPEILIVECGGYPHVDASYIESLMKLEGYSIESRKPQEDQEIIVGKLKI